MSWSFLSCIVNLGLALGSGASLADNVNMEEELALIQKPPKPLINYPHQYTQYPVPGAVQTHEIAAIPSSLPGYDVILVSQISNSRMVQMTCTTHGKCAFAVSHLVGTDWSGLHGMEPSDKIMGPWGNLVVSTLQFANKVVLVNVSSRPGVGDSLFQPPQIQWEISTAVGPTAGPHRTVVLDNDIYVSCKISQDIVRIKNVYKQMHHGWTYNHPDSSEIIVYGTKSSPTAPRKGPIFLQPVIHPDGTKYVYGTLDGQGQLVRIDPLGIPGWGADKMFIKLPSNCPIPVGLATQPGNGTALWFTCGASGSPLTGTGTFGRVVDNKEAEPDVKIWKTDAPDSSTGSYLHLAWGAGTSDGFPQLTLMSSSIFKGNTEDGLCTVTMSKDREDILKNSYVVMPRQGAWLHRVVIRENAMYVDGTLSQVVTAIHTAGQASFAETYNPNSDYSGGNLFGLGLPVDQVLYDTSAM